MTAFVTRRRHRSWIAAALLTLSVLTDAWLAAVETLGATTLVATDKTGIAV